MTSETAAIFSKIGEAQQKFDEARRDLDDAVAMFLTYREPHHKVLTLVNG